MLYFGNIFNAQPDLDSDGDGVTNFDEWLADTDPMDSNSLFRIENISFEPSGVRLSFQTSPIRQYQVEATEQLDGTPFAIFRALDGDGGLVSVIGTNESASQFYRVRVRPPP
jgi:hypothetical protein